MERIFVRFPTAALKMDALQGAFFDEKPARTVKQSFLVPDIVRIDASDADRKRLIGLGARIYEDVQFRVLPGDDHRAAGLRPDGGEDGIDNLSLADVMAQIKASRAWERTRGKGVTIAVVDTGVHGALREVEPARRSPVDFRTKYAGDHWRDDVGHGSMCAAIAAGSAVAGRYDGVAPEATVLAARSDLASSDLLDIYDELLRRRAEGKLSGPLVVTNSYGLYVCDPPAVLPADHPYFMGVLAAIDSGVFVSFAAGNNHFDKQCNHDPTACGPNSIWGPNSHDRVMSVGTVDRNLTNCDPTTPHANSSRGPGEWAIQHKKPDCVAPTYGEIPWGASYRRMRWWGTSGACPQVAGLAALVLSAAPALGPDEVADVIRSTCSLLPEGKTCVGRGVIDCEAAVDRALQIAAIA